MAKKIEKIVIPFAFEMEKGSLSNIKTEIGNLSKTLHGAIGKNFADSLGPELNTVLKSLNKVTASANKPVYSPKEAAAMGQSIAKAFQSVDDIIVKMQKNLATLWDPKAAQQATAAIEESGQELERLYNIRARFSKLIGEQRATGNETVLRSEKSANVSRQKELKAKPNLSTDETKELNTLIEREKELIKILKEKENIKEKIKALSAETGMADISSIDKEINEWLSINRDAVNSAFLPQDYDKINEFLSNTRERTKGLVENTKDLGEEAEKSYSISLEGLKRNEEQAKVLKQTLSQIIGIDISFRGLTTTFKRLIKNAFEFYKSLDAALTDITIVSNMSRGQVQELTKDFISLSKQTGMAIDDIAHASVIFFQQGLNTKEVMEMTEVTAQFAKVAGSTVEKAADQLTAAVNGFKVGVEGATAVADKLNAVAAKSAASIDEIATAMSKAASQANQAGLSMDKFYAILATMEEVTREAPENIGTSMKTIMARMQQIKEGNNTEDETDVNDVETALKTVGIRIRDVDGQLKDLETVLDELGPKWNSLDRNTQAYLGTIIAGTRQQSRFISMMQNWDRVLELTEVSENSAGQQALMHKKAMEGLDASINTLRNSWQNFLTALTDSDTFITVLKVASGFLDKITQGGGTVLSIFGLVNLSLGKITPVLTKIIQLFGSWGSSIIKATKSISNHNKVNGLFITKLKATTAALKTAQQVHAANNAKLQSYTKALDIVVTAENNASSAENNLASVRAKLEANIKNLNLTTEQRKDAEQQLLMIEELSSMTDAERAVFIKKLNNEYQKSGEEVNKLTNEYQQQIAVYGQVTGAIQMMIAGLGLGDTVMGSLIVGTTAFVAGLKMLKTVGITSFKGLKAQVKALSAAEKTSVILTGLSIVLTLLQSVVSLVQNLDLDGSKQLSTAIENFSSALDDYNTAKTKQKGLEELMSKYTALKKKVFLTNEEQQDLNDTIQAMSELTGIKAVEDAYGNLSISVQQLDIKMKEFADNTKKSQKELKNSADEMYKANFKSLNGMSSGMVKFAEYSSYVMSSLLSQIPIVGKRLGIGIRGLTKKIQSEWAKEAYEASKTYYASMFGNFSGMESGPGKNIEEQMIQSFLDSDEMIELVEKNDASKISDAIYEKNLEWTKIYSSDKMKNMFEDSSEAMEKLFAQSNEKSLVQLKQEINNHYDSIIASMALTPEQREAIGIQRQATEKALMDSLGLSNVDLEKIKQERGGRIAKIIDESNGLTLKALQEQNLFNGDGQSSFILQALIPNDAAQEEINAAFAQSGEAGYLAMYDRLTQLLEQRGIGDSVKEEIQKMTNDIAAQVGTIKTPTWEQWGAKLKDITQNAKEFANVLREIDEEGAMTEDTMYTLINRLDEMGAELVKTGDIDQLQKYGQAIDKIKFSYDAATNTYNINKESLKGLQDAERFLTQTKIDAYKKDLEMNRDKAQRAIEVLDERIKETEAEISALQSVKDAQVAYTNSEGKTLKDRIVNGVNYAKAFLKNMALIKKSQKGSITEEEINNLINNAGAKVASEQNNIKTNTSDNSGTNQIDRALANLNKTKTALTEARNNMINQKKTLDAMLRNWDTFSKVDWTKSGGNGKKAQKAAKEYEAQLSKILAILTHIELEEKKISILQTLRSKKTGQANIKNLLKEIELTEHLQEDYVELYNEQRKAALKAKESLQAGFSKIIKFQNDGSYEINEEKYNKLTDKQKESIDKLVEAYKKGIEDANDAYSNIIKNIENEMNARQEVVDQYIDSENKLVEAIKNREQKILDAKLAAIDKEIDAIDKVSEARRKARQEESDAAEMSGLQIDLQRALMDSSGTSASQILSLQKQIKDKQREMADNSFDDMVDDMKQQLEDEKEMEQALFDERLEEMDWYWAEVDRIMGDGVQSVLDTMKLYSDEYNQASEIQQTEILKGWSDTFERAVYVGKIGVKDMQDAVAQIQEALNSIDTEDVESALALRNTIKNSDFGIQKNPININGAYASGGMNYRTGLAWLDGTRSNPEAVLNAAQTKAFLSFADDLAALRASGAITNNSNVIIDTISFNVESMSSPEDGEKAFDAFVDRFKQIGAKQGISINGTANRF